MVNSIFRGSVLSLALLASACSTGKLAEGRLRSALTDAGLDKPNATCMAERMSDRLSLGQLKRLQSLQRTKSSLTDYVTMVQRLSDWQLWKVTSSAAVLCASGFAPEKR